MEARFWHQRWEKNEIAFHEGRPNPLLVRHFGALSLDKGSRVFLPLCGKTRDIGWLLANGHRVAGAELSRIAIEQLFAELGLQPRITATGAIERFSAQDIDIFVGDFFALSRQMLGAVDAIYDRAALVALPEDMRRRYVRHLMEITDTAPQMVICFAYDQRLVDGPPFSVDDDEMRRHYADIYELRALERVDVPGGLKGKYPAVETAWLLTKG